MKLHTTKDIISVVSATVGVVCLFIDKCYADRKQKYYIFFLTTIILIDSIFVLNKDAYEIDFGKNIETITLVVLYIIMYMIIFHYVASCG